MNLLNFLTRKPEPQPRPQRDVELITKQDAQVIDLDEQLSDDDWLYMVQRTDRGEP